MTKVGTLIRFNKNETDKKKNTHCNDFQAVFLLKHKAILCRFFYVCCIVGHYNFIREPLITLHTLWIHHEAHDDARPNTNLGEKRQKRPGWRTAERELVRKAAKVPRMTQKRPDSAARARIVVVI